jgi:hypothetical protein
MLVTGASARAIAILAALNAAGCGAGHDSVPAICPLAATGVMASGALVSPPNGATGVPPDIGRITFTTTSPDLQGPGVLVTLTPAGGGSPVQQPDSVITANGVSSSVIPPLRGATTYAVTVSATPPLPGSAVCQGFVSAALGSFTTQ